MKPDREILVEGFSMLKLISEGLKRAENRVFTMLGKDAPSNLGGIDSRIIPTNRDIAGIANSLDVDYVFPIAPEAELSGLVKGLTSNGIQCISSDVASIEIAADKLKTFNRLKEVGVDTPQILNSDAGDYPMIVKNRWGAACEGLQIVDSRDEIPSDSGLILQEFVRGENVSVTLFSDGKKAVPVSLNRQDIRFEQGRGTYLGGVVPFEHSLREEAFDAAKKTVESISELKGCIGVDMVLAEKPYVIEINPRVTTSMIALELASGLNVGKAAVDSFLGELPERPEFRKRIQFRKEFSWGECNGLRFEEV